MARLDWFRSLLGWIGLEKSAESGSARGATPCAPWGMVAYSVVTTLRGSERDETTPEAERWRLS